MAKPSAKSIQQQIWEQKLKIAELEDELRTQKYFETMPEYGPTYKYCYQTSSLHIPYPNQSIDNWIKAVIKHMGTRSLGHGGANTKAILVSIPEIKTKNDFDKWFGYQTEIIKKLAQPKTRQRKSKDV
jgi:hypothetical protein